MDDMTSARLQEAWQWIQLGRYDHALNLLTVLLVSDPDNAEAWWLLAIASGDENIRRRALRNLLRLRPDDPRAWRMFNAMGARPATQEFRPLTFPPMLPVAGQAPPFYHGASLPYVPPLRRRVPKRNFERPPRWFITIMAVAVTAGLVGCGLLFCTAAVAGLTLNSRLFGTLLPTPTAARSNATAVSLRSPLRYDQWRDGRLDAAGQLDGYNFSGHVGEMIAVQVSALESMTLQPALGLYGPTKSLLAGSATPDADAAIRLALTLPDDGEFVIVVGGQGASTGPYRLMLRHLH